MATATTALPADGSYTKIVDAAIETFTAQARSALGLEIIYQDTAPTVYDAGIVIQEGHAVSRADGPGSVYARPAKRPGVERIGGLVVVVSDA